MMRVDERNKRICARRGRPNGGAKIWVTTVEVTTNHDVMSVTVPPKRAMHARHACVYICSKSIWLYVHESNQERLRKRGETKLDE